jgi:hypothetical protein
LSASGAGVGRPSRHNGGRLTCNAISFDIGFRPSP